MKFRFNIAKKIALGFVILIIAVIINVILTINTLNNSKRVNEEITNIYSPSVSYLNKLHEVLTNSKMLIKSWVFINKNEYTPDKIELKKLHKTSFPEIIKSLSKLNRKWGIEEQKIYSEIYSSITDTLFPLHQFIMDQLIDLTDYEAPITKFEIIPLVEEGGEILVLTDKISEKLSLLIDKQEEKVKATGAGIDDSYNQFRRFIILMGLILVFAAIFIAALTIHSLVKPINYIKKILFSMGGGILPDEQIKEGNDEIGEMSVALNSLVNGLKDISNFSFEIGKGNFNSEFRPLGDKDILGNSLITMRQNLKKAAEEEKKRKKEDSQRSWATQGIAKFSEILRQNNDNIEELSYNIISNLVKYMDTNQGGLFIINDADENDVFIELTACYAYDRKKFLQKRIDMDVGLVGRCVQESETIYLTDIPNNYINIISGLGNDNPGSLLIVPLILNDEVFGVIEMASFKEIEPYQIEFVGKIGESIASTISTVKINIRTATLLEQSQQQAEEMAAQEEEMRQNMEELKATQEESARREAELKKELEDLMKLQKKDAGK